MRRRSRCGCCGGMLPVLGRDVPPAPLRSGWLGRAAKATRQTGEARWARGTARGWLPVTRGWKRPSLPRPHGRARELGGLPCTFSSPLRGEIGEIQQQAEEGSHCLIFTRNCLHFFISSCPLGTLPLLTEESSHSLTKQELGVLGFASRQPCGRQPAANTLARGAGWRHCWGRGLCPLPFSQRSSKA